MTGFLLTDIIFLFLEYHFNCLFFIIGWPPDKSRNMTEYLKPNDNTTIILPRVLTEARLQNVTYDDKLFNKTHVLIVCQSAVEDSRDRRDVIRKTWIKDTENLPVVVIFLVGMVSSENPNKTRIQQGR